MSATEPASTPGGSHAAAPPAGPEATVYGVSQEDAEERGIEMTASGLIRAFVVDADGNPARYRLRRPFFGELRLLRTAAETIEDEIADLKAEAERQARRIGAEAEAAAEDESLGIEGKADVVTTLTAESRKLGHALLDRTDTLREEWWRQTFDLLSLDGTPANLPAWVADPALIAEVVAHWRAAPFRAVGRSR